MKTSTSAVGAPERSLSFSSPDFDSVAYEKVARSANLREVSLASSGFSIKVAEFIAAEDAGIQFRPSFSGEPKHQEFAPDTGVLVGKYHWSVEVKIGRTKALKMNAEYVLIYTGLSNAPEEYVKLYFAKLARFTSYPYFRALLAMNVSGTGVSIPPLPSLKDRVD